ncbi:hypothetical protein DFH28DRAFT_931528 [Melampsora americana]|nr:hypothetical protein DFH28DRAFT_931528 [Melampsora americana]
MHLTSSNNIVLAFYILVASSYVLTQGDGSPGSPPQAPVADDKRITSPANATTTENAKQTLKTASGVIKTISGGLNEALEGASNLIKKVSNMTSSNTRRSMNFDRED